MSDSLSDSCNDQVVAAINIVTAIKIVTVIKIDGQTTSAPIIMPLFLVGISSSVC